MQPKYISPLTDWGFKKLFGEESSKDNLVHFLNAVFHEQGLPWIESLEIKNNERLGQSTIDRNAIFDLYCIGKNNERFIIELQKVKQKYFLERSLFYSTYLIQESADKGVWNFKIDPVYVICLLDFNLDDMPFVQDCATLIFQNRQKEMIPHFKFFFLECPKIKLTLDQDSSKKDKWLFIFKYLERLEETPDCLSEEEFERFLELASFYKLDTVDRAEYNASLKYRWDLYGIEETNLEKGRLQGLQQGLEQGLQQGLQQGLEQGLQQGLEQGKKEIAIALFKEGLSIEKISQLIGIDMNDLKILLKSY